MKSYKRVLVSVSDKSGLVELFESLRQSNPEIEIVSTGGTSKHLTENGFKVTDISAFTGFPEVMGGRVKTLHPKVFMGILGREQDADLLVEQGLAMFDLVVVNLYPFQRALNENSPDLIEFIDIGGPSLLRASAKNYDRVTVLSRPDQYSLIISRPGELLPLAERRRLAAEVFRLTSAYDSLIAHSLFDSNPTELRYGENPHQKASWGLDLTSSTEWTLKRADILQGKPLSYNNLLDLHSALFGLHGLKSRASVHFGESAVFAVAVKHNNPCALAWGSDEQTVLRKLLEADPQSVFGGIVALSFELNSIELVESLNEIFLEALLVPGVSDSCKKALAKKKNLRVLVWDQMTEISPPTSMKVSMGQDEFVQGFDRLDEESWSDLDKLGLDSQLRADVELAFISAALLKSNAIAIAGGGQSLGLGMGQVNRVDAVRQSIERYHRYHKRNPKAVLASDAFFPFPDSVDLIAEAGIGYVVQPGGSVKDQEVLGRAQELGLQMILFGRRHFRH